jgi:hypothetical protein
MIIDLELIFEMLGLWLWPVAFAGFSVLAAHKLRHGASLETAFFSYFIHGIIWPIYVYFAIGLVPLVIVLILICLIFLAMMWVINTFFEKPVDNTLK